MISSVLAMAKGEFFLTLPVDPICTWSDVMAPNVSSPKSSVVVQKTGDRRW